MIQTFLKKDLSVMLLIGLLLFTQSKVFAQNAKLFLGVKLHADVQAIAEEIESKTKRKIYAEYVEFAKDEHLLGSSYFTSNGTPILRVNVNLMEQSQKVEAVVAHELLHLRLRANNFPVFLFAPTVKTKRGLAQDVEQSNINDLASLIEHRAFKAEMEKFGLHILIDISGDAEQSAIQRNGEADSQADAINFARALLEYQRASNVEELRKIYLKNNWRQSLKIGQKIADIIQRSQPNSPAAVTSTFKLCLLLLYPSPRPFKLKPDKTVTTYQQLLIGF
jgi:hypothetical protein